MIDDIINAIYKDWFNMEKESRRPARASTQGFKAREDKFRSNMKKPLGIAKVKADQIIKDSGIIDWVEEHII